ncbi:MAG: PorT family protein [Flavobacteriaceae bacterium]|nr:PorT family protein [Flavobacteriaceae bacterium]
MSKKNFFLAGLSFFIVSFVFAQKDRIEFLPTFDNNKLHFGFYLGINQKGFSIKYNKNLSNLYLIKDDYITVEESLGFNIGLVADYKLHDNINLRFEPGLSSNTKTLTYTYINSGETREVPGTYLRLPLLLKFSTNRLDNMRAFVIGGVSYDYNFSSNQGNSSDNRDGEFRMKKHNYMYEVGIGVDLYLYYFKFSPSIRGIFAINNEIVPDTSYGSPYTGPYTGPVDYFGTRGIFLNFTFE